MPDTNMEFQFVNSTISCPTVPQDLAIRSMIRKQAMKQTSASRKRTGNYGKHNLRQYPIFLEQQEVINFKPGATMRVLEPDLRKHGGQVIYLDGVKSASNTKAKRVPAKDKDDLILVSREHCMGSHTSSMTLHRSPSAQGFEQTCMKTNFDILLLSTLATLHVCRPVRHLLSQNPSQLILQLHAHRRSSYFLYIPSRYDDVACLRDATDCVIARTQQVLSPDTKMEQGAIRTYVKALRSLQAALDDPTQRLQPEVLCAAEILALYEVILTFQA